MKARAFHVHEAPFSGSLPRKKCLQATCLVGLDAASTRVSPFDNPAPVTI